MEVSGTLSKFTVSFPGMLVLLYVSLIQYFYPLGLVCQSYLLLAADAQSSLLRQAPPDARPAPAPSPTAALSHPPLCCPCMHPEPKP